jgi:hypothetical protein
MGAKYDPQEPTSWNRYICDAFIVWLHDREDLMKFQRRVNSTHQNIRFMRKTWEDSMLPHFIIKEIARWFVGT